MTDQTSQIQIDGFHVFSHSRSYRLPLYTIDRIRSLQKASVAGLRDDRKYMDNLQSKIQDANDRRFLSRESSAPTVTLSESEMDTITWAMAKAKQKRDWLPFYLHSVLVIALWSAFESYLQSILGQVYLQNNSSLASDKQISVRDLVEHRGTVTDFLIEKEIDAFGHHVASIVTERQSQQRLGPNENRYFYDDFRYQMSKHILSPM